MGIGELKFKEEIIKNKTDEKKYLDKTEAENLIIINREIIETIQESLNESFNKLDSKELIKPRMEKLQKQFTEAEKIYSEQERSEINKLIEELRDLLGAHRQLREKLTEAKRVEYKKITDQLVANSEKIKSKRGLSGEKQGLSFWIEGLKRVLEKMEKDIDHKNN